MPVAAGVCTSREQQDIALPPMIALNMIMFDIFAQRPPQRALTQQNHLETLNLRAAHLPRQARGEVAELKDNINTMIDNLRLTTDRNTEQDWLKTDQPGQIHQHAARTARSRYRRPIAVVRAHPSRQRAARRHLSGHQRGYSEPSPALRLCR